jgi:hypothetical protein
MCMSLAMHDTSLHVNGSNEQVCLLLRQSVAIDFWKGICFGFLVLAVFGHHKSYWQHVCIQSPGDHMSDVTTCDSDAAVIVLGQHAACWAVRWESAHTNLLPHKRKLPVLLMQFHTLLGPELVQKHKLRAKFNSTNIHVLPSDVWDCICFGCLFRWLCSATIHHMDAKFKRVVSLS